MCSLVIILDSFVDVTVVMDVTGYCSCVKL